MELAWSPEAASKAYIDTVRSCKNVKESGTVELLSAMAAGWNSSLIVESWSHGSSVTTSVGLAIAAVHSRARHVCLVSDEESKSAYLKAMTYAAVSPPEVAVGTAEDVMKELNGVDFLVVDCKRRDFARILSSANLSKRGAVLVRKDVCQRDGVASGFRWDGVVTRERRVVRTVVLPVGKWLDIAYVGNRGSNMRSRRLSRWIKHIDRSGEEHLIRG